MYKIFWTITGNGRRSEAAEIHYQKSVPGVTLQDQMRSEEIRQSSN
jgi:hypothetical protein